MAPPPSQRRISLRIVVLSLALGLLAVASRTWAHPADMYYQAIGLQISAEGLSLTWRIYPGPLIARSMWLSADLNRDEVIDPAEARQWAEPLLAELAATLEGGWPLQWRITAASGSNSFEYFQIGDEPIVIELAAAWPLALQAQQRLDLHNLYQEADTLSRYTVSAVDGLVFAPPRHHGARLSLDFGRQPGGADALTTWDSGTPVLDTSIDPEELEAGQPGGLAPPAPRPALAEIERGVLATLAALVRRPDLSPGFYFLALVISVAIGALHALTPGHGKAVVAAYLVGSQGTMLHAVALGGIVTLTHTGSVFLLGLVVLLASQYMVPTDLFPALELASGLLIVALGAGLLLARWRAWRSARSDDHHHHHHGHGHEHPHAAGAGNVSWRSLLALGVSGGLVPCPDAIAILLVAIAINRVLLGLSLILTFSLGLALVLIVIGLAVVRSRRLLDRATWFDRLAPFTPMLSALVVLALGLALAAGALHTMI